MKLLVFTALIGFLMHGSPVRALEVCDSILDPVILPRQFRLSEEAVQYLLKSEEHHAFIISLSKIFGVLDSGDEALDDVGVSLREQPDTEKSVPADLAETSFFRGRRSLITDSITNDYFVLSNSALSRKLDKDDLALLAFLLRDIPKNEHGLKGILWTLYEQAQLKEAEKRLSRTRFLLVNPNIKTAVQTLLQWPEARAFYGNVITHMKKVDGVNVSNVLDPEKFDAVSDRLSEGRLTRNDVLRIEEYISSFLLQIYKYAIARGMDHGCSAGPFERICDREKFLSTLAPFFAEKIQIKSQLNNISNLIDGFFFGAALPLSAKDLYDQAIKGAGPLLLPLKSEYAAVQSKVQSQLAMSPKESATAPFKLKLIDHFQPKTTVRIRTRPEAEGGQTPESSGKIDVENQIPAESSLRSFTSFSREHRDISELVPLKTYQFWFLREEEPSLQQVRISEAAVDWMKSNRKAAVHLLNALHLGRARKKGEAGVKIMSFHSSDRFDGPVFELKTANSIRGILLPVEGHWELVTITNKDDFERSVKTAAPID